MSGSGGEHYPGFARRNSPLKRMRLASARCRECPDHGVHHPRGRDRRLHLSRGVALRLIYLDHIRFDIVNRFTLGE
jgi:hypothetical protein